MIAGALLFGGCGRADQTRPAIAYVNDAVGAALDADRSTPLPAGFRAWSATVPAGATTPAHSAPDAASPIVRTYPDRSLFGFDPTVFRIMSETRDAAGDVWYRAQLPPLGTDAPDNGAEAWIRAGGLDVVGHNRRLVVDLSDRTITHYDGDTVVDTSSVGIGKARSATPEGEFFVWTKWTPAQGSHPAYGHGAIAISARSDDLESWQGGSPLVAMHGTSRSADLGAEVSNGCIRMSNDVVDRFLAELPLGTPITIVA